MVIPNVNSVGAAEDHMDTLDAVTSSRVGANRNWARLKRAVSQGTADFLGLSQSCDPDVTLLEEGGNLGPDAVDYGERDEWPTSVKGVAVTKGPNPEGLKLLRSITAKTPLRPSMSRKISSNLLSKSIDHTTTTRKSFLQSASSFALDDRHKLVARLSKRESVAGLAWDELKRMWSRKGRPGRRNRLYTDSTGSDPKYISGTARGSALYRSRSFAPGSLHRRIPVESRPRSVVDGRLTGRYDMGRPPTSTTTGTGREIWNLDDDDVFFDVLHQPPAAPPSAGTRRPRPAPSRQPRQLNGREGVPVGRNANAGPTGSVIGLSRIKRGVMDQLFDRVSRRTRRLIGQGVVMDLLNDPGYSDSVWSDPATVDRISLLRDYRPFFTYWITTVQVLVLVCAMAIYGTGLLGVGLRQQERILLKPSLSLERAGFLEPENFWIGPNAFALIHLGAKYGPCMRPDPVVGRELAARRADERRTACCLRNDGSGCIQAVREECQDDLFFTWLNGTVCSLDPNWCSNPQSTPLRPWPVDLTAWPVCKAPVPALGPPHMTCDLIGRPCCIGIRGACIITTQEYCSFVRGHFHKEAALCSQVSCLGDVCGMVPFAKPTRPDQIYRLWCSVFLHAGLVHLAISLAFQLVIMRDLEKLAGPVRIGIIYFGSGIGGNLASAIFLPDRADVGPAGAQFGLLACVLVELIQNWPILKAPGLACGKLATLYTLLLFLGLLPWIDNYAHVFGFAFGFLLSFALLPYLTFGPFDRRRKQLTVGLALASALTLAVSLLGLFYGYPDLAYRCKFCKYFDCLPLDPTFCHNYEIVINK